ncbi:DCR1B exonuclease, partial [Eubucco bourcierii]|nr:DCR1B exonuclease [Eubucco bourcierii]
SAPRRTPTPAPPTPASPCPFLRRRGAAREIRREAVGLRPSAMNGMVIPGTPIAVDFWSLRRASGARLFFLYVRPARSDPVRFPTTWSGPHHPARLPQVPTCWIRPLEVGQSHVLGENEKVTVTLLDSNHCPGSVMFLFEGTFGTILHTGDFRYSRAMRDEPVLRGRHIDRLYLDNTYCHPQRALPSRQHATRQAIHLIRTHPQHLVVIGLYSLGKEKLLVDLALEFSTWVVVSPWRLEQMRLLELPDVFTTEEGTGWIRAVDVTDICWDALVRWNKLKPTLAILPTGRPMKITHPNIHLIPYSDHSSFSELCEFVEWLKPCSVIPIVKGDLCQAYFQKYLNPAPQILPEPQTPKLVQESVQQQSKRKGQEPCLKRAVQCSVARGVIFESPEKCTEKSEELMSVQAAQQNYCKSAFTLKKDGTCQMGKGKGKEEMSGEQSGIARPAASQAPFPQEHFPAGLAEEYLLVPTSALKQFSAQNFDKLIEDFLRW